MQGKGQSRYCFHATVGEHARSESESTDLWRSETSARFCEVLAGKEIVEIWNECEEVRRNLESAVTDWEEARRKLSRPRSRKRLGQIFQQTCSNIPRENDERVSNTQLYVVEIRERTWTRCPSSPPGIGRRVMHRALRWCW